MTKAEAKKIGGRQALKAVGIGLLIAQFIMTLFSGEGLMGFFWLFDFGYALEVIIGASLLLLSGYFFGQYAGVEILIKGRSAAVGIKYGIATLFTTVFSASWIAFFKEGLSGADIGEVLFDYIYKPIFWVCFFGIVPVVLVGFWFGRQIEKRGQKKMPESTLP